MKPPLKYEPGVYIDIPEGWSAESSLDNFPTVENRYLVLDLRTGRVHRFTIMDGSGGYTPKASTDDALLATEFKRPGLIL